MPQIYECKKQHANIFGDYIGVSENLYLIFSFLILSFPEICSILGDFNDQNAQLGLIQ